MKIAKPEDVGHVSWSELVSYTCRRLYHTWKKTYTKSLDTYREVDAETACIETDYGPLFFPRSMNRGELKMVLRETLDNRNWHHYNTAFTPLDSSDVVADCGASEGFWGLFAMERVGKMYLIEPQKAFVKALEANFRKPISLKKAEIIEAAIGKEDGTCSMKANDRSDIAKEFELDSQGDVPIHKLDTLFRNEIISYIKADVEGFEMDVLSGAGDTIKRCKPKIAITTYHQMNDWKALRDFVLSLVPEYKWKLKGMTANGKPVMLHMWVQ